MTLIENGIFEVFFSSIVTNLKILEYVGNISYSENITDHFENYFEI